MFKCKNKCAWLYDDENDDDDNSQYALGRIPNRTVNIITDNLKQANTAKALEISQIHNKTVESIDQHNTEHIYHTIDDTCSNGDRASSSGHYNVIGEAIFNSKKVKLFKADKYKVWHKSIVGGFVNGDNKETQEHLSNERERLEKEHTVHDSDTYCSNDSTHVIAGSPPNIFPYNINEGDIDGMDTEAFSKLCKTLKRMTSEYTVCEDIYLLESEGAHDLESNCFKGKDIRQDPTPNFLVDTLSLYGTNDNTSSDRRGTNSTVITRGNVTNTARQSKKTISTQNSLAHTGTNRILETSIRRLSSYDSHTDDRDTDDGESQYVLGRIITPSHSTVEPTHIN